MNNLHFPEDYDTYNDTSDDLEQVLSEAGIVLSNNTTEEESR
jgi:hypothetical protein